jgi:transposase-like protein
MGKQRKTWTVEQTLTLILAALRDERGVAALARQHGVSEQQIYRTFRTTRTSFTNKMPRRGARAVAVGADAGH